MPKKEVPKYDRIGFQLLDIHERFQDRTRQIGYDGWTGRGRASQLILSSSDGHSYNTVWMVRGKPGKSHEISAIARDHGGSLP